MSEQEKESNCKHPYVVVSITTRQDNTFSTKTGNIAGGEAFVIEGPKFFCDSCHVDLTKDAVKSLYDKQKEEA